MRGRRCRRWAAFRRQARARTRRTRAEKAWLRQPSTRGTSASPRWRRAFASRLPSPTRIASDFSGRVVETHAPPPAAGGAEAGAPRAPPTVFARQGSGVPNSACARIARHRPHPFAAWRHFGHSESRERTSPLRVHFPALHGRLRFRRLRFRRLRLRRLRLRLRDAGDPRGRATSALRWTRRIGTSRVGFVIVIASFVLVAHRRKRRVFVLVRVAARFRDSLCPAHVPRRLVFVALAYLERLVVFLFAPFVGIVIFGRLFLLLLVALRLRRELAVAEKLPGFTKPRGSSFGQRRRSGLSIGFLFLRVLLWVAQVLPVVVALFHFVVVFLLVVLRLRRELAVPEKRAGFPHAPRTALRRPAGAPSFSSHRRCTRACAAMEDCRRGSARRRPSWTAGAAGRGHALRRRVRRGVGDDVAHLLQHQAEIRDAGASSSWGDSRVGSSLRGRPPRRGGGAARSPRARRPRVPSPGPSRAVVRPGLESALERLGIRRGFVSAVFFRAAAARLRDAARPGALNFAAGAAAAGAARRGRVGGENASFGVASTIIRDAWDAIERSGWLAPGTAVARGPSSRGAPRRAPRAADVEACPRRRKRLGVVRGRAERQTRTRRGELVSPAARAHAAASAPPVAAGRGLAPGAIATESGTSESAPPPPSAAAAAAAAATASTGAASPPAEDSVSVGALLCGNVDGMYEHITSAGVHPGNVGGTSVSARSARPPGSEGPEGRSEGRDDCFVAASNEDVFGDSEGAAAVSGTPSRLSALSAGAESGKGDVAATATFALAPSAHARPPGGVLNPAEAAAAVHSDPGSPPPGNPRTAAWEASPPAWRRGAETTAEDRLGTEKAPAKVGGTMARARPW